MSQEEWTKLRESVPYVKIYRYNPKHLYPVAYPGIGFEGGVQQIQLRTEDREDGDLGAVTPYSGVLEAAVIWYKKFHFI